MLAPAKYQTKPAERHLRCLRKHIALCQAHIESINDEIFAARKDSSPDRLQRLLKLHRTRLVPQQQAKTCREAISPISWVPSEVLGEIFTHCLPFDHRFSRTVAPLLLLRVCQLWRDTAISTRSLWSRISFWTPASHIDLTCYPLRFLGDWLMRSGTNHLDIFLEQGLVYHHMKFVVEAVLLAHYPQCRHLDIHVTSDSAPALISFITLPPGSLAGLESLVLEGLDEAYFTDINPELAIQVFQNSPQLRKLTTNALNFAFSFDESTSSLEFDPLVLPWAQITHLMITDFITAGVLVVTLAECTALQFLRVSLDLEGDAVTLPLDEWLPDQPVALTSLAELHISISGGLCIPHVMDALVFPALRNLHFRRSETEDFTSDSFSWAGSLHFLYQLRNLDRLSLVGRVGVAEEILLLLQSAPRITHLQLDISTEYQFLIPTLFPPLDAFSFNVTLARPLHALTHLAFRLDRSDFPFPAHCIRDSVDSALHMLILIDLLIIVHRACHRQLEEIRSQFSFSSLQPRFGTPAGPIGRSTRYHTDGHLIDFESTNRQYTAVDPLLVNFID